MTTTLSDSLKTSTEIFADLRSQDSLPPKIMINLMPVSFEKNTAFGTNLSGTVIVIEESPLQKLRVLYSEDSINWKEIQLHKK